MSVQPITVRARCPKCRQVQTARVCRKWYNGDTLKCCGELATLWLDAKGKIMHDGATFYRVSP